MFTGENSPSLHDVVDLATRGVNLIGTFFVWGGSEDRLLSGFKRRKSDSRN